MRTRFHAPTITALILLLALLVPATAAAARPDDLRREKPVWMTPAIEKRIAAAGTEGVHVSTIEGWLRQGVGGRELVHQDVLVPCFNGDPRPGVSAGACQVAPYGCTANFIFRKGDTPFAEFSDGRTYFIGIAGHCVDHANQPVFMEVENGVVAKIGEVEKVLKGNIGRNGRGYGGLGNDYAIIEIDQGLKVNPGMPAASGGGPQGIYTGCEAVPVKYWGHGYALAVGPGKTEGGLATNWNDRGFGWTGVGFPGDSGAGVLVAGTNQAAGDLTHLLIGIDRKYPGSDLIGTRVTRALTWMGGEYRLVNEDRTYARADMSDTRCGGADSSLTNP